MSQRFVEWKRELVSMLSLAGPVVLAELGWMSMSTVDTMMVGKLGPEEIGAVGIGSSLYLAVAIFGLGLQLGLDTLVSQAFGSGRIQDCHRSLLQGVYLSILLTLPLMLIVVLTASYLRGWGVDERVAELAGPYVETLAFSTFPLLLYGAFRRYLQAMNLVKPITFALVSANLVNVATNWILIFGHLGAPALGVGGAGWATLFSRAYMAFSLLVFILWYDRRHRTGLTAVTLKLDWGRLQRLTRLGFPAALQVTLEVGVFAAATALAGKLQPVSLAAHQIALSTVGVSFMVPLGISAAGAVRVGQALGRRDPPAAARSGWAALLLGGLFMTGAALILLLFPATLLRIFTRDPLVTATGVSLLFVAAFFQVFDGIQVVATGIMRGAGDTRTPMFCNLAGHWLLGLPVGYLLCFTAGWGVVGLWIGLSIGLTVVGLVLLGVWTWRVRGVRGA